MGRSSLLGWAVIPTASTGFSLHSPLHSGLACEQRCRHARYDVAVKDRHRQGMGSAEQISQRSVSSRRQRIRSCPLKMQAGFGDDGRENDSDAAEKARLKAESALRQLTPEELEGMKARLDLDDNIHSGDEIIAQAIPIIAARILAKQAIQQSKQKDSETSAQSSGDNTSSHAPQSTSTPSTPPRSSASTDDAYYSMPDNDDRIDDAPDRYLRNAPRNVPRNDASDVRMARSRKEGSVGEWVAIGGDGEERGWVGEKGNRRWVGPPGEKPPRQRHKDREPDVPLAPGQRAYFATCPRGLETVLRDELMSPAIGATMVKSSGRGCHFRGDQSVGYKAILWLRTAHRVLELVGDGGAPEGQPVLDADSLYEVAAAIPWSRYMTPEQTVSIDAILGVVSDGLTHSHFTALTVKNAIIDQFRNAGHERPSVDTEHPDLPLVVYLDRGRALLYRCLSGTRSMHKRGYRDAMHAASLKENVAAGLLLASGWDAENQALADPMCGSGTLVIEAALIAMRRAPGLVAMGAFPGNQGGNGGGRGSSDSEGSWKPAVRSWPDFDEGLWRQAVAEAMSAALPRPPEAIMGNDWHHGALSLAWRDAKAAGVEHCVTLFDEDVAHWRPPVGIDLAVTNPPWDQRLDRDAERSWQGLLEFLRREVAERDAWVLSGNPSLSRVLRMKSDENLFLATGGVELRWLKYHLNEYRGDRKRGTRKGPRPRKVSRAHDRPAVDKW